MLVRILGGLLVAVLVALAPTAAFGYTGSGEAVAVSNTNPGVGEPFTVTVSAGAGSSSATLDICGLRARTKATNAAGDAYFTVTLYREGTCTLTGYDQDGNVVGQTVVVVGDGDHDGDGAGDGIGNGSDRPRPGVVIHTPADGGHTQQAGPGGILPSTGAEANMGVLAATGALLMLAGGALVYTRRRRDDAI